MKLLSIRLHPFGGTPDRSCKLTDGLNVLEGPNEFGKSTLNHALWHGLFTPTNLPPARLVKAIGRWYPLPGGDHASVTLEFEAGGHHFTLQKTWGAGSSAKLQASGAAAIADPGKVQETLLTLLSRNEATWRHILFTSQAQLARTIDELKSGSSELDDVQSLLAGAAAIPGDIAPEKLVSALNDRVEAHYSRWDTATNGPERGRGIDNPWANRIGPVLATYYAMENVRRELGKVVSYEKDVDDVNGRIQRLKQDMAADGEFIRIGRSLRDGLGRRAGLEERCQRLAGELQTLKEIMVAWPGAAQVIQAKETELAGVTHDLESLEVELQNARKRGQAEQMRLAYQRLTQARDEWQRATDHLAESKTVPPELLAELKRLEPEIERLRIQIAAQKLSAKLESAIPLSVTVRRGAGDPEIIPLSPSEAWEGQAEGIFRMEFQDLKLSVGSGTGDVNALFTGLESALKRHSEILNTIDHDSLAAAQAADAAHQKLVTHESTTKGLYNAALQGRSEEEWSADMAALADLPETRSVGVLEHEKTTRLGRKATLGLEIQQVMEKIEKWTTNHVDLDSLTHKILTQTADSNQAKLELAGLPVLPDGFTSMVVDFARIAAGELHGVFAEA